MPDSDSDSSKLTIEPALLRLEQLAAYLGYSAWTVPGLVRAGVIPKPLFLRPGGPALWRRSAVDAAIARAERSRKPRPEPRGFVRQRQQRGGR